MRWTAALTACAGCFAPTIPSGSPCANAPCPSGLVCSPATSTCELTSVPAHDATLDGARPIDGRGAIDARMVDAAPDAFHTAMLVQQITGHVEVMTSLSVVLSQLPASGAVLMMVGATPNGPIDTVSGGGVTTWTRLAGSFIYQNIEIWVGVTDGTDPTVTIARTTPGTSGSSMWVGEWSGLATPIVVDGAVANDGTTSPAGTSGVTTAGTRDLVVFGVEDGSPNAFGIPTPGAWSAATAITSPSAYQSTWYRIADPVTAVDPTVTETHQTWDAALVALHLAP